MGSFDNLTSCELNITQYGYTGTICGGLEANGDVIIVLLIVEINIAHSMSKDFRGASSRAMHDAGWPPI